MTIQLRFWSPFFSTSPDAANNHFKSSFSNRGQRLGSKQHHKQEQERFKSVSMTARALVSGQKAESCARDEQPYHGGGCHGGDGRLHEGGLGTPAWADTALYLTRPLFTVAKVKLRPATPLF